MHKLLIGFGPSSITFSWCCCKPRGNGWMNRKYSVFVSRTKNVHSLLSLFTWQDGKSLYSYVCTRTNGRGGDASAWCMIPVGCFWFLLGLGYVKRKVKQTLKNYVFIHSKRLRSDFKVVVK